MDRRPDIPRILGGSLALAGWLLLAAPAQPQEGSGLVISALPSELVIGAAEGAAIQAAGPALPVGYDDGALPAQPRAAGMPRPSIIVGDLAILAGIGPRGALGMPFAAREAIRQRDPALFERLLGRGVFDPREDRLAEALQTELLRLGCYDGRIDGAWGAGSERAVERWRDAAQIEIAAAAGVPLYRAILRGGEVTCPEIARPAPAVAAPAAPRQPRAGAGGGAGRAAAVKRRPAAAQQPAQPAQKPGTVTINPKFTGAGIYR